MAMKYAKICVVGRENAGKSTLVRSYVSVAESVLTKKERIVEQGSFIPHRSSSGIRISSLRLPLDKTNASDTTAIRIWDFSGKQCYNSTHSFFFSEATLYIVTWNARIPLEESGLLHWVRTINSCAPKSAILLVATHFDTLKADERKAAQRKHIDYMLGLRQTYKGVASYCSIGFNDFGIELMAREINLLLNKHQQSLSDPSMQLLEHAMQPILLNYSQHLQSVLPVIYWSDFEKIATGLNLNSQHCFDYLNLMAGIGKFVYFPGKETIADDAKALAYEGFVFFDVTWLIHFFSTLINETNEHLSLGIIPLDHLKEVWKGYSPNHFNELLKLLDIFGIGVIYEKTSLLLPSMLDEQLSEIELLWPSYIPKCLQYNRQFLFDFAPSGFFPRLLSKVISKPGFTQHYWRSGVILVGSNGTQALVTYDSNCFKMELAVRSHKDEPIAGMKLFGELVELINSTINIIFSLNANVIMPCPVCLVTRTPNGCSFSQAKCEEAILFGTVLKCEKNHEIQIDQIAPDIAMTDIATVKLDMNSNDWQVEAVIGEGGFATVHRGKYRNQPVAIKIIKTQLLTEANADDTDAVKEARLHKICSQFNSEVKVMSGFKHINLVNLIAYCVPSPLALILELCVYSDLYTFLQTDTPVDWALRLKIGFDILQGLSYLHSFDPPMIHRDLKSPNIMISSIKINEPCAKISDFGLSKKLIIEELEYDVIELQEAIFNPTWLAPEVVQGKASGTAMDIYSFGIIAWEIVTREHPFGQKYAFMVDLEEAIVRGERPTIPESCPPDYTALIQTCWAQDPETRPNANAIIQGHYQPMMKKFAPQVLQYCNFAHASTRAAQERRYANRVGYLFEREYLKKQKEKDELDKRADKDSDKRASQSSLKYKPGEKKGDAIKKILPQVWWCPHPEEKGAKRLHAGLRHFPSYKLYNLSDVPHDYSRLDGIVAEYSFDASKAPSLELLRLCIADMTAFIRADENNKVVLHCKGKYPIRSCFVAAVLLYALSEEQVLLNYNFTFNSAFHFVDSAIGSSCISKMMPSQLRYLRYYELVNKDSAKNNMHLHKLKFSSVPSFKYSGGCAPVISILHEGKTVIFQHSDIKGSSAIEFFCREILITGDVKFSFYHKNASTLMFSVDFNMAYEKIDVMKNAIRFRLNELDIPEGNQKNFPKDFCLYVYFLSSSQVKDLWERGKGKDGMDTIDRRERTKSKSSMLAMIKRRPSDVAGNRIKSKDETGTNRGLGRKNSVSVKALISSTSNVSTSSNPKERSPSGVSQVTSSGVEVVISDPILEEDNSSAPLSPTSDATDSPGDEVGSGDKASRLSRASFSRTASSIARKRKTKEAARSQGSPTNSTSVGMPLDSQVDSAATASPSASTGPVQGAASLTSSDAANGTANPSAGTGQQSTPRESKLGRIQRTLSLPMSSKREGLPTGVTSSDKTGESTPSKDPVRVKSSKSSKEPSTPKDKKSGRRPTFNSSTNSLETSAIDAEVPLEIEKEFTLKFENLEKHQSTDDDLLLLTYRSRQERERLLVIADSLNQEAEEKEREKNANPAPQAGTAATGEASETQTDEQDESSQTKSGSANAVARAAIPKKASMSRRPQHKRSSEGKSDGAKEALAVAEVATVPQAIGGLIKFPEDDPAPTTPQQRAAPTPELVDVKPDEAPVDEMEYVMMWSEVTMALELVQVPKKKERKILFPEELPEANAKATDATRTPKSQKPKTPRKIWIDGEDDDLTTTATSTTALTGAAGLESFDSDSEQPNSKCELCGISLGSEIIVGTQTYDGQAQRFLCTDCGQGEFFSACLRCAKKIPDNAVSINSKIVFGKIIAWHNECFQCDRCAKMILTTQESQFNEESGRLLCSGCGELERPLAEKETKADLVPFDAPNYSTVETEVIEILLEFFHCFGHKKDYEMAEILRPDVDPSTPHVASTEGETRERSNTADHLVPEGKDKERLEMRRNFDNLLLKCSSYFYFKKYLDQTGLTPISDFWIFIQKSIVNNSFVFEDQSQFFFSGLPINKQVLEEKCILSNKQMTTFFQTKVPFSLYVLRTCQINCVRELGSIYYDYLRSDIYKNLTEHVSNGHETSARINELTKGYFSEDDALSNITHELLEKFREETTKNKRSILGFDKRKKQDKESPQEAQRRKEREELIRSEKDYDEVFRREQREDMRREAMEEEARVLREKEARERRAREERERPGPSDDARTEATTTATTTAHAEDRKEPDAVKASDKTDVADKTVSEASPTKSPQEPSAPEEKASTNPDVPSGLSRALSFNSAQKLKEEWQEQNARLDDEEAVVKAREEEARLAREKERDRKRVEKEAADAEDNRRELERLEMEQLAMSMLKRKKVEIEAAETILERRQQQHEEKTPLVAEDSKTSSDPADPIEATSVEASLPAPSPSWPVPTCGLCEKGITGHRESETEAPVDGVTIKDGSMLHSFCFLCQQCGCQLSVDQSYLWKDQVLMCAACARVTVKKCDICYQLILKNGFKDSMRNYHQSCMQCSICVSSLLGKDQRYYWRRLSSSLICQSCVDKRRF